MPTMLRIQLGIYQELGEIMKLSNEGADLEPRRTTDHRNKANAGTDLFGDEATKL